MRTSKQRGYTLIEMLVVVGILVILTGTVLPKLDRIILKDNKGVAGSTAGEVSRYIQTYRIMHNVYPDHWDSLMQGPTTLWSDPGGVGPGLEPQLTGELPGSPHKLITTTFVESATVHELRSITRMGIYTMEDVTPTTPLADLPGNMFFTPRTLATGSTVATLNVDGSGGGDPDAIAIVNQIYKIPPTGTGPLGTTSGIIPPGNKLVVFGFGPLNDAVGDVMQETPYYPNTDPTLYYNRYLAIFEVHADGSRAELKMVTGADGDRIADEIGDYYQNLAQ